MASSTVASETNTTRPNFLKRSLQFFRDSWGELKRVRWPNRKELLSYTVVVVITCLVVIAIIALYDLGISYVMNKIGLGG